MPPLVRRLVPGLCRGLRPLSTSPPAAAAVAVTTDAEGVAVLSMNKAPVNSLNTEFIQELTQAVVDTEKAAKVREGISSPLLLLLLSSSSSYSPPPPPASRRWC